MIKRYYNLDWIKLICSVCIVLHHYEQLSKYNGFFWGGGIPFGYLVELFFIISGFLAVISYKDISIKENLVHKFKSIYPLTFVSTLISLICIIAYEIFIGTKLLKYSFSSIIQSFFLIFNGWIRECIGINNPTWYICILWICLLIFFIIQKTHKFKILLYIMMVFIGVIGWKLQVDVAFYHVSNCRGYTAFFIGVLLGEIVKQGIKISLSIPCVLIVVCAIITIVLETFSWYILSLIVFPSIIVIIINIKQMPISSSVNISFEIYLFHVPMYYSIKTISNICGVELQYSLFSMIIYLFFVLIIAFFVHHGYLHILERYKG